MSAGNRVQRANLPAKPRTAASCTNSSQRARSCTHAAAAAGGSPQSRASRSWPCVQTPGLPQGPGTSRRPTCDRRCCRSPDSCAGGRPPSLPPPPAPGRGCWAGNAPLCPTGPPPTFASRARSAQERSSVKVGPGRPFLLPATVCHCCWVACSPADSSSGTSSAQRARGADLWRSPPPSSSTLAAADCTKACSA